MLICQSLPQSPVWDYPPHCLENFPQQKKVNDRSLYSEYICLVLLVHFLFPTLHVDGLTD